MGIRLEMVSGKRELIEPRLKAYQEPDSSIYHYKRRSAALIFMNRKREKYSFTTST